MNGSIRDIRALLGPLDPDPNPSARVEGVQSSARSSPALSRRTILVGAASAVAVGLVATQVVRPTTGQHVELLATPAPLVVTALSNPPDLAGVIERWAAAAAASQAPTVPLPATEHLAMSAWYLDTAVSGATAESQLRAQEVESWRRPDGSWTVTTSDGGTETFAPGQRATHWPDRPPVHDTQALDRWLNAIHPLSQGDDGALTISAIRDLLRERALLPAERASVLRLLGTIPGIRYAGSTIDRAGRPGEALVLETRHSGLPERQTLVVDPATGAVLAYESMLTEDAGALNVAIPAVLTYETYLVSRFE